MFIWGLFKDTVNNTLNFDIIKNIIPSKKIAETESLTVIQDIHPQAPVHYLIIPRKHVQDIQQLAQEDLRIAGDIFAMAQQLSAQAGDFKLLINSGKQAGQQVMHLHAHFLAQNGASQP